MSGRVNYLHFSNCPTTAPDLASRAEAIYLIGRKSVLCLTLFGGKSTLRKVPQRLAPSARTLELSLMSVQMELHKIIISEMQDQQIIVLKEVDGERKFPIVIGSNEAMAIDRRLKSIPTPRPMTHDLLANTIESMGGSIEKIEINDLQDHTFFAKIHIRQGNKDLEVDSRPSDAIALGIASVVPIYVAEHVLAEVG